jgi:hypothetical protein
MEEGDCFTRKRNEERKLHYETREKNDECIERKKGGRTFGLLLVQPFCVVVVKF